MGSICASLHAQGKLPRACQGVSAAALRTNPAPWLPVPSAPTLDILSRASLFLCTHSLSPAMVAPCMLALWTLFAAISSVVSENVAPVPVFRLGSGAVAPSSPAYDYKTKNQPRQPDGLRRVQRVLMYCTPLLAIVALTMMVPGSLTNSSGGGGSRDFNYRIPPSWSPENEHNYSFRAFMTDISVWVMLTDLQPHQQCAALLMRLVRWPA